MPFLTAPSGSGVRRSVGRLGVPLMFCVAAAMPVSAAAGGDPLSDVPQESAEARVLLEAALERR
jgi:hypothetical protein